MTTGALVLVVVARVTGLVTSGPFAMVRNLIFSATAATGADRRLRTTSQSVP